VTPAKQRSRSLVGKINGYRNKCLILLVSLNYKLETAFMSLATTGNK
jgi:hypothetical protein